MMMIVSMVSIKIMILNTFPKSKDMNSNVKLQAFQQDMPVLGRGIKRILKNYPSAINTENKMLQ